jgi:hypothetical protein
MTAYPVRIRAIPAFENRNRLTTAVRFFLTIPHLILVGGPLSAGIGIRWTMEQGWSSGSTGGLLGIVVCLTTVVMWFVIVVTAQHVGSLWRFAAYYMRWRVRVIAYLMLLRDEYPPFGDDGAAYPVGIEFADPPARRNRVTVFFRLILTIPHAIVLGLLNILWAFTTAVAWLLILVTGRYPEPLYGFALGVLAWSTRVEAYVLLLCDDYPPFSLRT